LLATPNIDIAALVFARRGHLIPSGLAFAPNASIQNNGILVARSRTITRHDVKKVRRSIEGNTKTNKSVTRQKPQRTLYDLKAGCEHMLNDMGTDLRCDEKKKENKK